MIKPRFEPSAGKQRAQDRLYVLCQLGGWGSFLGLQLYFSKAFSEGSADAGRDRVTELASYVMVALMGLVLTHYSRWWMTRRGWKQMGWRSLVPRVLLMAAILSLLWNGLGYGYSYGVLGLPWPSKYSVGLILTVSLLNGIGLMVGWLSIYFFHHTLDRIQRMQIEQLSLVANVKEAELRALKSQVNPHFLFNSLNSLRALIDEDAPRAREAVTRLANLLRYSLHSGQVETVLLKDELDAVQDYLALEQIRHEERLLVRWEVAAEARFQSVPPMVLQTLVENAVKYGISTRPEGGLITISAQVINAVLHIRVSNPGELVSAPEGSAARGDFSTGVGLRNASERLKLLYGDQAALQLRPAPAGCVTAEVLLPCKLHHS